MLGLEGKVLSFLNKTKDPSLQFINGYILYQKNFDSAEQLGQLTNQIQVARERANLPPAIIAVDHEGGRVQRFTDEHFTQLPNALTVGKLFAHDNSAGKALIEDIGLVTAAELGNSGINLCLGPSLDLNSNFSNRVTKRAYSEHANDVIALSSYLLSVLKKHGMNAVGKHYPGFGAAVFDTHSHFPVIENSWDEINESHLLPFKSIISQQLVPGIMLTHGAYINIDLKSVPASSFWLQKILREQYQFEGIIMTDCLGMISAKPLGESFSSRISNCLHAGCDIVLISYTFNSMFNIIKKLQSNVETSEFLSSPQRQQSNQRIVKLLENSKPIDYYKNLIETQVYKDAKSHIIAFNNMDVTLFISQDSTTHTETSPDHSLMAWFRKHMKKFIKPLISKPWSWEILSSIYLRLIKINKTLNKAGEKLS